MYATAITWLKAGQPPYYVTILGIVAFAALEWVLPRTKLFRANSTLEALANLAKRALLGRIPLLGRLVVALATPEAQPALEQPPRPPKEGGYVLAGVMGLIGFVAIALAALFAGGCAANMSTFYKSISTSAVAVTAGYRELDKADADRQAEIRSSAHEDPAAAQSKLNAWLKTHDAARKALEVTDDLTFNALRAAPAIDGIIADHKAISHWLALLEQAGAGLARALADAGVQVPLLTGGTN